MITRVRALIHKAGDLQGYINYISSAPSRRPNHSSEYPWTSYGAIAYPNAAATPLR